jgi:colanic acid biosynthesis glycosyl transferase WcaI
VNICVLCPHFRPDPAATGVVITHIADELVARGHRLHVVTALPWYVHHRVEPEWSGRLVRHEDREWGRVTRVHPFPTDKTNIPARALAFGGFTALAIAEGVRSGFSPDVVLAMSPPLTLGVAGWLVARRHRAPFVFNIQDVFPDVAVELGVITNPTVIRLAQWLERFCYRRADAVTVLSEDLRDNLSRKVGPTHADRIEVIPNFVDTERIRPIPQDTAYRSEHDLLGRTVVMYAGNVGLSQSLDLVLDAARALADRPEVVFVINGGGSALEGLRQRATGLANVRFVDFQPEARVPEVLASADIHVVPLKRGLARSSVPSKLYAILAAGRPIVASVDPGTEVANVVERAGAGVAVPPDDGPALLAALGGLLDDPARAAAMGISGRRFVESWASPAAVAAQYEALFGELIAQRG